MKHGLPVESKDDDVAGSADAKKAAPALQMPPNDNIPPFLRQSLSGPLHAKGGIYIGNVSWLTSCYSFLDIHRKFEELEWIERGRLADGLMIQNPSSRWALEGEQEVKARNRYPNVQAWANSRIHLRVPDGECDFINASPVVLRDIQTNEEHNYIATQVRIFFFFGL